MRALILSLTLLALPATAGAQCAGGLCVPGARTFSHGFASSFRSQQFSSVPAPWIVPARTRTRIRIRSSLKIRQRPTVFSMPLDYATSYEQFQYQSGSLMPVLPSSQTFAFETVPYAVPGPPCP